MTMFDGPGGGSWPGFGFTVDGAGCVFTDGDVAMSELLSSSIVTVAGSGNRDRTDRCAKCIREDPLRTTAEVIVVSGEH